jgi:hypothetical protein
MDSMIAKLRVALQLDSAAFESGTNRAAQQVNALGINMDAARARMNSFSEGLIVSGNTAQRMGSQMRAVNDNAGLMRAGLQNAGYQLQDMAVQFASGQRAGTIFAQQLPQLSGAIAQIAAASGQTTGIVGKLAGFLGGPWGVAVGVGTAVLSPFIAKLFETGRAADQAALKVASFGDLLAKARTKPAEALGDQQTKVLQAQTALNKARALPVGGGSAEYIANTYAGKKRAEAIRQAELDLQAARSELETLQATVKNNESLFQIVNSAGRLSAKNLSADKSGGGSSAARRAGQDAGREYRSGLEDELRKLSQTTNDLEATVFKPLADRSKEQLSFRDSAAAKFLQEQLADVSKVVGYTGEQIQNTNRRIGDSFVEMTDRTLSSLQELSNGIRSGDFLGTLSGVIHLFGNLASTGLFGGKLASLFGSPNGRADGGPVSAGRMYMVGERGPELFLSKGPGTIVPNHNLRGSGGAPSSIQVVPSPYFDVVVDGRVIRAAPTIADAGGNLGFQRVARANSRRLA